MQEKPKKKAVTSSAMQFHDRFPDEASARSFVEQSVWDGKPTCPKCGSRRHGLWTTREGHYRCKDCRKIYSVRIGTVFENSHLPLRHWLYAIYRMQTARKGISSPRLAQALGITQKSAWFMLRRIRASGVNETLKVSGEAEMDATDIGDKETERKPTNIPTRTRES